MGRDAGRAARQERVLVLIRGINAYHTLGWVREDAMAAALDHRGFGRVLAAVAGGFGRVSSRWFG